MSLTMTIRFTDDGFSLRRRERGYGIGFFARPRLDSDEESRILSFFESDGIHPVVDYLAERGRQRVLEFPIPGEIDAMVGLCRRLLTEVHSMRRGDRLDYHPLRESDLAKRADPAGEA
jgi:hypothetical protein